MIKKEPACQCRRWGFNPWVGKIPMRRKWQPTPLFLPGESHGQKSLADYSSRGCKVRHDWSSKQQKQQAVLLLTSPWMMVTTERLDLKSMHYCTKVEGGRKGNLSFSPSVSQLEMIWQHKCHISNVWMIAFWKKIINRVGISTKRPSSVIYTGSWKVTRSLTLPVF